MLRSNFMPPSSGLNVFIRKMEGMGSLNTLLNVQNTTRNHTSKDSNVHCHSREKLRSQHKEVSLRQHPHALIGYNTKRRFTNPVKRSFWKLLAAQLHRKLPGFILTKFHYRVHKSLPPDSSRTRLIHSIFSHDTSL
jgi:hypothetical protein